MIQASNFLQFRWPPMLQTSAVAGAAAAAAAIVQLPVNLSWPQHCLAVPGSIPYVCVCVSVCVVSRHVHQAAIDRVQ